MKIVSIFIALQILISQIAFADPDEKPIQLQPILVTPGKFTIREQTQSTLSLTKTEIEKFPLIDNDVLRSAHIFPGIASNDYSARFHVRGGEKDEMIVRLDGMELFEPYHLQDFGGAISILDLGLIQSADLIMGGFPAEYGDKMSGVLDLFSKSTPPEKLTADLGVDLINAHALVSAPIAHRGSWSISARRGYIDLILGLIGATEDLNPRYGDIFTNVNYKLTEKDRLSFNAFYTTDQNLINSDDDQNDLRSAYKNAMSWTKWRHNFSDRVWTDLFLFGGFATRDRRVGDENYDLRDLQFFGSKFELTARNEFHEFRSGLELRGSSVNYDYFNKNTDLVSQKLQTIEKKIDDRSGLDLKGFLQDQFQIGQKLAINFGLRYIFQNYREMGKKWDFSPRIAIAFQPTKFLIFRSAFGKYHQPITLATLPIENGIDHVGPAEIADHYIFGVEFARRRTQFRAEAYLKNLDQLSGEIRDYGRKTQIFTDPISGLVKGFDLFWSRQISDRVLWNIGYAFSIATEKDLNDREFYRSFDQRHALSLNSSFQISPKLHLNTSWRFHTGNPTPTLSHLKTDRICERSILEIDTDRLLSYHSLDIRLTRSSEFDDFSVNWYLQILNLYNRSNVHERAFSENRDDETDELISCDVVNEPLFPIVPTFGVNFAF